MVTYIYLTKHSDIEYFIFTENIDVSILNIQLTFYYFKVFHVYIRGMEREKIVIILVSILYATLIF